MLRENVNASQELVCCSIGPVGSAAREGHGIARLSLLHESSSDEASCRPVGSKENKISCLCPRNHTASQWTVCAVQLAHWAVLCEYERVSSDCLGCSIGPPGSTTRECQCIVRLSLLLTWSAWQRYASMSLYRSTVSAAQSVNLAALRVDVMLSPDFRGKRQKGCCNGL